MRYVSRTRDWLIVVGVWLGTTFTLVSLCAILVLVVAGPLSSALPASLQTAVLACSWIVVLIVPITEARLVWRRRRQPNDGAKWPTRCEAASLPRVRARDENTDESRVLSTGTRQRSEQMPRHRLGRRCGRRSHRGYPSRESRGFVGIHLIGHIAIWNRCNTAWLQHSDQRADASERAEQRG